MTEQRLIKAREQLVQIETLLRETPNDRELLDLRSELLEIVRLAESLEDAALTNEVPAASQWTTVVPRSGGSSFSAGGSADLKSNGTHPSKPSERFEFLPDQRCEVKTADCKRWQGAIVTQRLPDFAYRVTRLHDDATLLVRGQEIREMPKATLRHEALVPGMKVRARYSGDGKYYQAVVEKRAPFGCTVCFEGYEEDEPEKVALEHVRLADIDEAPAMLVVDIPKHMTVLPNDSDEVKAKKLRLQKSFKRKAKEETIDKVQEHKQDSWLAFQATAKRVKGAMTTLGAGQSQLSFKSNPNAPVGVTRPKQ